MAEAEIYHGKTKTEWAAKLGISRDALISRIKRKGWENALSLGGPVENARRKKPGLHTYKGESKTLQEWADVKGVTKAALYKRATVYGFDAAMEMPAEKLTGGNRSDDRFKGKLITWNGVTKNRKEWGVVFGRCGSRVTKTIARMGSVQAAFEHMAANPARGNRQHGSITTKQARDILRESNGPGQQYGSNFTGGKVSSSKNDIKIIIECESIHHPLAIGNGSFGVRAAVGYQEEILAGARKSPSNETGMSLVIRRGIERGAIKCAETGRAAVAMLCEICTMQGCGVRG